MRTWVARTPIWVRVSVVVALVLAGVLLTTMVVGGTGVGARTRTPCTSGHHSAAGHPGGQVQMSDHIGAGHGQAYQRGGGGHASDPNHAAACPR